MQLATWVEKFDAIGVNVAAMTYDSVEILKAFQTEQNLGYVLLRDEDVHHVNGFGIRNEEYEAGHRGYGIPHPGIFYLSSSGEILAKFAIPGYRERPPMEAVFETVQANLDQ